MNTRLDRLTRPTQSGWYHKQQDVKGRRTPDGGNHYFLFGGKTSLCKKHDKDVTWKLNNTSSWGTDLDEHRSICKDCLELYTSLKNKSNDDVMQLLVTPHHIHQQVCTKCGQNCIYLSNNKEHVHTDRIHIGCNGHEVPLVR